MAQNMTKGSPPRHLLTFVVPLILGELFQLGYNAVDSIVVGRFAGDDALAAVGAAAPVMNMLIIGIMGLSVGAGVLMANFFGADQPEKLRSELGLTLVLCAGLAAVLTAAGLVFCRPLLQVLNVPAEILALTEQYLLVVLLGKPFTALYNAYAAALRSVGDSKTPVVMLAVSGIANIVLDLWFVIGLDLGVLGAALATDIAVIVSVLGCIWHVSRNIPILHLEKRHFKPDKALLAQTLGYGGTVALQYCCQPIGKVLIQGQINTLGISTIAAFNAVGKIEDFVMLPMRQMSSAITTFTAQNDGADQPRRMRDGFLWALGIQFFLFGIGAGALVWPFHQQLLGLFSAEQLTLVEGGRYFAVLCGFYWVPALSNTLQGLMRGMGKLRLGLCASITQILFRVIFTYLLVPSMGIAGIALASVLGWAIMVLWESPFAAWMLYKRLRQPPRAAMQERSV